MQPLPALVITCLYLLSCTSPAANPCLCRSRDSQDVSIGIYLKLVAHGGGSRFVTDSVEEPGDGKVFLFAVQYVLDAEVVQKVTITLTFDRDGVPEDRLRENKIM